MNKWLPQRIAALRGARTLAVLAVLPRALRSARLALHLPRSFIQGFLTYSTVHEIFNAYAQQPQHSKVGGHTKPNQHAEMGQLGHQPIM